MDYGTLAEAFAIVAVFFSVVWAILGYRGIKLGYLLLGRGGHDRAVELLRERYGRGEITTEEFDERMRQLRES